ncbi:MAG: hypothetical protein AB7S80_11665 [Rhizobiaceae bacterium]
MADFSIVSYKFRWTPALLPRISAMSSLLQGFDEKFPGIDAAGIGETGPQPTDAALGPDEEWLRQPDWL